MLQLSSHLDSMIVKFEMREFQMLAELLQGSDDLNYFDFQTSMHTLKRDSNKGCEKFSFEKISIRNMICVCAMYRIFVWSFWVQYFCIIYIMIVDLY